MSEQQSKRPHRPRPRWAAWCLLLAALPMAGAQHNQTHCNPTVISGDITATQTGAGAVRSDCTVRVQCSNGSLGNPCAVCCYMSYWLWNPILDIWHEVTDVHCQTDWATCNTTMDLDFDAEATGLPVGYYLVRAQIFLGPCDEPGAWVMNVEKAFTIR